MAGKIKQPSGVHLILNLGAKAAEAKSNKLAEGSAAEEANDAKQSDAHAADLCPHCGMPPTLPPKRSPFGRV